MPKRAMTVEARLERSSKRALSHSSIAQRTQLAELIRARMAQPATAKEKELWLELKAEIDKERVSFRP